MLRINGIFQRYRLRIENINSLPKPQPCVEFIGKMDGTSLGT
jgi:hypothetical protein